MGLLLLYYPMALSMASIKIPNLLQGFLILGPFGLHSPQQLPGRSQGTPKDENPGAVAFFSCQYVHIPFPLLLFFFFFYIYIIVLILFFFFFLKWCSCSSVAGLNQVVSEDQKDPPEIYGFCCVTSCYGTGEAGKSRLGLQGKRM